MLTHSHTTQNNTPMQNFPQYNYYSFLLTGEKHSVDLHRKWAATHREAKQSAGKQGQGTQPQHLRKERKPTEQNKQTKQSHPLNAQRTRKQYYKINSALWSTVCRSCLLLVSPFTAVDKAVPFVPLAARANSSSFKHRNRRLLTSSQRCVSTWRETNAFRSPTFM